MDEAKTDYPRIEKQAKPQCTSVSLNKLAGTRFQSYLQEDLRYRTKRAGLLYGTMEEGNVSIQANYEPSQSGTLDSLKVDWRTAEEKSADDLADLLRLQKVGRILAQTSKPEDFFLSNGSACGQHVSAQYIQLKRNGWISKPSATSSMVTLRNPEEPGQTTPVVLEGQRVGEVPAEYFLVRVDDFNSCTGQLKTTFGVENRLNSPGVDDLKQHVEKYASKPDYDRFGDFHLLLFLCKQPGFEMGSDMAAVCDAVLNKTPVPPTCITKIAMLSPN